MTTIGGALLANPPEPACGTEGLAAGVATVVVTGMLVGVTGTVVELAEGDGDGLGTFDVAGGELGDCGDVGVPVGDTAGEGETDGDTDADGDGETEADGDGETGTDGECEGDGETDGETEGDADGDTEGDADGETTGELDGETDGDTEGETDGETDGETEGETDGETEGDGEVGVSLLQQPRGVAFVSPRGVALVSPRGVDGSNPVAVTVLLAANRGRTAKLTRNTARRTIPSGVRPDEDFASRPRPTRPGTGGAFCWPGTS